MNAPAQSRGTNGSDAGGESGGKGAHEESRISRCTDGAADEEGRMEGGRGMTRGHMSAAPDWKTSKENTSIFIVQ